MQDYILQNCNLFTDLTMEEKALIIPLFHEATFSADQTIVHEDEPVPHLYIIKSGKAELSHKQNHHIEFAIEEIDSGSIFGEQSLLPHTPSPVNVKALTSLEVYAVNAAHLINAIKNKPDIRRKLLENIGINLSHHLDTHAITTVSAVKGHLNELQTRIKMGIFVVYTLAIIFAYNMTIEFVDDYINPFTPRTYVTVLFLGVTALTLLAMIKHMEDGFSEFGFTLRNWKADLWEATWWSLIFIIAIVLLKWGLINFIPKFNNIPLFDLSAVTHIPHYSFATHNPADWYIPALLYILFVPVQAFIVQGAFQSALMRFLIGEYSIVISILLADLLFASIHVDLDFTYAIAVVVPGLMWGALYAKQRSLLGVSWSHMLIGFWALWLLGFDRIFGLAPPL